MPIKIEAGAKIIADARLTPIRVVSTLFEDHISKLKDGVKESMIAKGVRYAQNDFVIAMLRPGAKLGPADPVKLYKLHQKGKLTMKQFLSVIKVEKGPLAKIIGEDLVNEISTEVEDPKPSLLTELKEGLEFNPSDLQTLINWSSSRIIGAQK